MHSKDELSLQKSKITFPVSHRQNDNKNYVSMKPNGGADISTEFVQYSGQ